MQNAIEHAAGILLKSKNTIAFTGAGISVESGIPPFRGENGLWNKYDPEVLELDYFYANGERCWHFIREIFYDFFGHAKPNAAHYVLARLENAGLLNAVITQNIDNLHQMAGSNTVYEFHGSSNRLVCPGCGASFPVAEVDLARIPPRCPLDNRILKPDFIFFGEGIPPFAYEKSFEAAKNCEVCLIVGSTGEVAPASDVPLTASRNGAFIIEINPESSLFTNSVTDLHLEGRAGEVLMEIGKMLFE
jgi:NAD-dependent deacetylase